MLVAGVDGCAGKWLVATGGAGRPAHEARLALADDFADVLRRTADCAAVCLDMPIGLPEGEDFRTCDRLAQLRLARLGARVANPHSRVFAIPPRRVVEAKTPYPASRDMAVSLTGKGFSRQAFGVFPAILDVDRAMTPELQRRVVETHPELCFARLAGRTLHSKKTALGALERADALNLDTASFAALLSGGEIKPAHAEDALDALACLDAAAHVARTADMDAPNARRLPGDRTPPRDAKGLRMEMWF